MKIAIVTCAWRREQLVDIAQRQLARVASEVAEDVELILVGSEESMGPFAQGRFVMSSNLPLGRKWNRALQAARLLKPDAVMIVGSDNVLDATLVDAWAAKMRQGAQYVGLRDSVQWIPDQGRLVWWPGYQGLRKDEPAGSGRCISAALLDSFGWHLWDDWIDKGLDRSATERLASGGIAAAVYTLEQLRAHHVGVKVNTMSRIPRNVVDIDPTLLVEWFGDIGEELLRLATAPVNRHIEVIDAMTAGPRSARVLTCRSPQLLEADQPCQDRQRPRRGEVLRLIAHLLRRLSVLVGE